MMKKIVTSLVFILHFSMSLAQNTMVFKNEVRIFDTVMIENPIVVRILDVGQDYLISESCLDSLLYLYPQLTDSIMNLSGIPLYSCVFFKFLYYSYTSKEEYESFFGEEIDPSTVLRFKCPKLITVMENIRSNYSINRMPNQTIFFMRVKITGSAYNHFVFGRVMDGPLKRPLLFEQPDSEIYLMFPIEGDLNIKSK